MRSDDFYMQQCLELAAKGGSAVRPNPHVGCVIVHDEKIIGRGYHESCGGPHAEVNAINSVADSNLLKESTLYVSLEPCSHWGKTPPCVELILRMEIPRVVVGIADPFPEVSGRGIRMLREAGVAVTVGVMEHECREINYDFICFYQNKRPYIILKWAETCDGFLDNDREATTPPTWMTGNECKTLVHHWRSEVDAIMVGTNTIQRDNPSLTVRMVEGKNPLRIVPDRLLKLPKESSVFDSCAETMIITDIRNRKSCLVRHPKIRVETLDFEGDVLKQLMVILHRNGIMSLFVEGGKSLLDNFIKSGLWDEMRIFRSPLGVGDLKGGMGSPHRGVKAPTVTLPATSVMQFGKIELDIIHR